MEPELQVAKSLLEAARGHVESTRLIIGYDERIKGLFNPVTEELDNIVGLISQVEVAITKVN